MQQPPYLKSGDVITIISSARKITNAEIAPSIELLESWGLNVKLGENLFEEHHQFAGTKEQRIQDLQTALNDNESKAILCARGGYGTVQLIDSIDFSYFKENPKWLIGFSDVTVLHNHINQNFGIESIHATMPINFPKEGENKATLSLKAALFGGVMEYNFKVEKESILPSKSIQAPIVGGNLSIIYSIIGTTSQIDTKGKFLFLEDLDEYLYHIDRMMMNLKRAGLFKGCKGILVGGMSDMNDNAIPYGSTAKEIILENIKQYDIPIVFGVPAGHIKENLALIMNRQLTLTSKDDDITITFNGRT